MKRQLFVFAMTREEYLQLFDKYLAGQATPDEITRVMTHADDFELASGTGIPAPDQQATGERIFERVRQHTGHTLLQRSRKLWWAAAAVVAVLITAGLFIQSLPASNQKEALPPAAKEAGILPGSSKATLTLADGRRIILNDAGNGTILQNSHLTITKEKNGLLRYSATAEGDRRVTAALNTLSTPRGGEYKLILPDGTRVWLNAASTLTFPASFNGRERSVLLTGEGYFEVAKNKHKPFRVKFRDQEVEVLGTHFDIMAYPDDASAKTTLMEGSVKISRQQQGRVLLPGQQAVSTGAGSGFQVAQVDLREVMAWKDGFLAFRNTTIQSIMQQAARWYDVDVVYQEDLNGKIFGGRISKYSNISELLHNLELTGTIHFKMEGRRVTVMP